MSKRMLEELNLLDDFLFGSMVTYSGIGEDFVRKLLKIILQKDIGNLTVIPQKYYYGSNTDKHGARLDVYLEENDQDTETAAIYDIEPNQVDKSLEVRNLPRRVRFYHAKIDSGSLKSGMSYKMLKKVVVIMITPYDPFDMNRMVYTIRRRCVEEPSMPYDDGEETIFLNTRGTEGNPSEELQQLMHYMENTTEANAKNKDLQEIQKMVETVKQDGEVSLEYMKIFEREEMLIEKGIEEGIKQGRREEQANTEREHQRAESEKSRADTAEQEIQRLKQEIENLKRRIAEQ